MKILFLAANPQSTSRLKLDTELREIEEALKLSSQSNEFELIQKWDVRPRDFRRALLEYEPEIVHFSGHGEDQTGLVIIDPSGVEKLVPGEALAGLFAEFSNIKCVLLNACYSEVQAQAIVKQVDYVIGMKDTIYDKAAIAFSIGFYDGLGYGRNLALRIIRANNWWSEFWARDKNPEYINILNSQLEPKLNLAN